jgi:hypothetical protein
VDRDDDVSSGRTPWRAQPTDLDRPDTTPFSGTITAVQPRIRLTRSFDQRSHAYLAYMFRINGQTGGGADQFIVALGQAA